MFQVEDLVVRNDKRVPPHNGISYDSPGSIGVIVEVFDGALMVDWSENSDGSKISLIHISGVEKR